MAGRSIVWIDPDASYAGRMAAHLVSAGVDTHYARTIREGLWLAGTQSPDAIVLATNFPDGASINAARDLYNDPDIGAVPVLALTDDNKWEAVAHNYKPFIAQHLFRSWPETTIQQQLENFVGFERGEASGEEIDATVDRLFAEDAPEVAELVRDIQRLEDDTETDRELRALSPVAAVAGDGPPPDATPEETIRKLRAEVETLKERMSIMDSSHALEIESVNAERQALFAKAQRLGERVRALEAELAKYTGEHAVPPAAAMESGKRRS